VSDNFLRRLHKKARNAFTDWAERSSQFWGGWSGFFESFMLFVTFGGALFAWAYAMAYLKNRPEELARPPRMTDEQQERDGNRGKAPTSVFIVPVCNDEKGGITRRTDTEKKEEFICVSLDHLIQLRIGSGNVDQASVSGAVKRND